MLPRRNKKQAVKMRRYDFFSLPNRDIINKYTATVRNKFDLLHDIYETNTVNEEYENFITANIEVESWRP